MNFHGPGWACAAVLLLVVVLVPPVRSQGDSSAYEIYSKSHLPGIRKLNIQKINSQRPVQITSASSSYSSLGRRFFVANQDADAPAPTLGRSAWARRHGGAPIAAAPVVSASESGERSENEKRVDFLPVAARGLPTQVFNHPRPAPPTLSVASPEVRSRTDHALSREEQERRRQERIQARWRKIGPLIGSGNPRSPYGRMRFIQPAQPIAWTHVHQTTTPLPAQTTRRHYATRALVPSTTAEPLVLETETIPPSKPILPEPVQPVHVASTVPESPMIRRINKHPIHVPTAEVQPSRYRAFGQRSLFNGPLLEENSAVSSVSTSAESTARSTSNEERFSASKESNEGPIIVEDTSRVDYHSRSSFNASPVKRFKLTNKLSYRPRLKIRRPDEQFAARADTNAKSLPLQLPELDLIDRQVPNRHPLPVFEETGLVTPHRRIVPNAHRIPNNLRPLPMPAAFGGDQNIQVEPPPPPKRPEAPKPAITEWSNEEDFSAVVTESAGGTGGGADSDDSGLVGAGDTGAGFGGDIGTPPPGFAEAFNLNGAGSDTTTPAPTTKAAPPPPKTTRRPPPPPPPEEPFVVPENSGLRPVAPPKEFTGGFGSSRGSTLSGFGGGGGGGGGSALPSAPQAPHPRPMPRGRMQPESDLKEEDFFTGDSALTPNRVGPSGDGFGPAVFPGVAPPPPVPAVSVGGGAAGIPPYRMISATENTPTTVKPSALLSILNKADEGFNQAITHFESGTPVETAAIDILEVALGSQKLDSQAKLLGHVDRTLGLDNLQRLQRWANTGGAFDMLKEQFAKFAKNFKPPEPPEALRIPPQLEYLFSPSG